MTEAEAEALVEGWEQAFLDQIVDFTASFKHVRCTFMVRHQRLFVRVSGLRGAPVNYRHDACAYHRTNPKRSRL
jgi:hypothetical protein